MAPQRFSAGRSPYEQRLPPVGERAPRRKAVLLGTVVRS
jgi:hypothetical protein